MDALLRSVVPGRCILVTRCKGRLTMAKIILLAAMLTAFTAGAFSASPATKILNDDEIAKLSDKELTDAYIDVSVEIEASTALRNTSGYTPEEYDSFKGLLRYRIVLINEIKKRKLEVPQTQ